MYKRQPLYRYKALNARGEVLDGQMEAASDAEVVLRLQEQGHLPMEARPAGGGDGLAPVSYTHLDVYKRQGQNRGRCR